MKRMSIMYTLKYHRKGGKMRTLITKCKIFTFYCMLYSSEDICNILEKSIQHNIDFNIVISPSFISSHHVFELVLVYF